MRSKAVNFSIPSSWKQMRERLQQMSGQQREQLIERLIDKLEHRRVYQF